MKHLIFLTSLFFFSMTNAQQQKDILYLRNGSIIKGTITEMDPSSGLKIKTADGSLFVFTMDEVEKMEKETISSSPTKMDSNSDELQVSGTTNSNHQPDNTELSKVSLGFQPAGFLQYGPVIDLGFRVGKNSVIGPHFRYASLGLAYNAINEFKNTFLCLGGGASFKYFPAEHKKNKFYYGISVDLLYEEFEPEAGYYYYTNILSLITMPNVGYRFRFDSGFYINLGGYAGLYLNISDGEAGFWGYAEFGIGVEFK